MPAAQPAAAAPRGGNPQREAEYTARKLFLVVLAREPEPGDLRATAVEIQRGNLEQRIRDMVRSPEYRSTNNQMTPDALLERFYQSAFGRDAGKRAFLPLLQTGRTVEVIEKLLTSEEFEKKMRAEIAKP